MGNLVSYYRVSTQACPGIAYCTNIAQTFARPTGRAPVCVILVGGSNVHHVSSFQKKASGTGLEARLYFMLITL